MTRKGKGGGRVASRSTPTGKDGWEAGLSENHNDHSLISQVYRAAYLIEITAVMLGWPLMIGSIIGKLMDGGIA